MIDGARPDFIDKVQYYNDLKKESIFFSQMISYAPYTIASLHATFSGMYGNSNGVNGYYQSFNFNEKSKALQEYLKGEGYYTECDLIREDVLTKRGFDKWRVHDEFKDNLIERHSEILNRVQNKKPFFLFFDYSKIHTNLVHNVIKKYSDFDKEYFDNKEKNAENYLKWVGESGNYLEAMMHHIKKLGLLEDSTILVFNDHGTSVGEKIGEKNYGSFLYDYTIKCFLYLIDKDLPKNKEVKEVIRSIDILPTILDMLKIKEAKNFKKMQGKSFLSFIDGKTEKRIAYSEAGGLGGPTPSPNKHNVKSARTDEWKLIYNETNKKKELYNIKKDPQEEKNLFGTEAKIEKYLWDIIETENRE